MTLVVSSTDLQIYYMVVGSPEVVYYVWLFAMSDSDTSSVVSSREAEERVREERVRLSSPLGDMHSFFDWACQKSNIMVHCAWLLTASGSETSSAALVYFTFLISIEFDHTSIPMKILNTVYKSLF